MRKTHGDYFSHCQGKETAKEIATVGSDAIFKGNLKEKGDAGAEFAITQMILDPQVYVVFTILRVREGSLDGARTILAQAVLNLKASCCIVPRAMYAGIRLSGKEMRVRD